MELAFVSSLAVAGAAWCWWTSGLLAERIVRQRRLYGSGLGPAQLAILAVGVAFFVSWRASRTIPMGRRIMGGLLLAFGAFMGYSAVADGLPMDLADWTTWLGLLVLVVGPILAGLLQFRGPSGACAVCERPAYSPHRLGDGSLCCSRECLESRLETTGHFEELRRLLVWLTWARRVRWAGLAAVGLGLLGVAGTNDDNLYRLTPLLPVGIVLLALSVLLEWLAGRAGSRTQPGASTEAQ